MALSLPPRGRVAEPKAKPGGRGLATREPVLLLPSPPHPVGAARRRPSPKGEGEVWGMTLLRLLSRRVGEGAGRPGLARCCCRVTVSTKPDLGRPSDPPVKSRSGRDGAAPRSRFPRALRLAALASGLTGSPPLTLLPSARGGHDFRRRPAQEARGEQAQAIHRPPQGPPRYPSPGLHRSTTARRHRGAGSDALPTDGMSKLWGRSQP